MVVGRRDVGGERTEGVGGRLMAQLLLQAHRLGDLVHRDVPGAFDHHLHTMGFRDLAELAERAEFGELGGVVGIGDRPWTQPVAQRERHVVPGEDFAEFLEVRVQEGLRVVGQAPGRHDRPAAADDSGNPPAACGMWRSSTPACTVMKSTPCSACSITVSR